MFRKHWEGRLLALGFAMVLTVGSWSANAEGLDSAEQSVRLRLAECRAGYVRGDVTREHLADAAMELAEFGVPEPERKILYKGAFFLYARAGRIGKAVIALEGLRRLMPQASDELIEGLIRRAATPLAQEAQRALDLAAYGKGTEALRIDSSGRWKYLETGGAARLLGAVRPMQEETTVPEQVDGFPVVEIAGEGFSGRENVVTLSLPQTLRRIGGYAFEGCGHLRTLVVPEGVVGVCGGAFRDCTALQTLCLPGSVRTISPLAFDGCTALEEILVSGENESFSVDENGVLRKGGQAVLVPRREN